MSSMTPNWPRKISFEEFGDLLQKEWEEGNLSSKAHEMIQAGRVPIAHLREKLRWIIERDGDGLRLTVEDEEADYRAAA